MNAQTYAISAYRSAQSTVAPLRAVVLLYDGVLVHIRNASQAFRAKDYETHFNEIMRAADILLALNAALDMKRGGSVAVSLRAFYETTIKALISSASRKSALECAERIERGVRTMRDAWAEIAGEIQKEPAEAAS